MGLLGRGADMLTRRLAAADGDRVVAYTRGAVTLAVAGAVVGRTTFTAAQQGAARVERSDRDYLIPVAALVGLGTPAAGDRITETVNGVVKTYECKPPRLVGEPPWRFSDATETVYRIHCKQVA